MNRPYRVWDKKEKKMYYDGFYITPQGEVLWRNDAKPNPEDYVLEQATGLKDKNGKGKEVYEGDKFKVIYSDVPNGLTCFGRDRKIHEVYGVVVYKWSGFYVEHREPVKNEIRYADLAGFLKNPKEIIGTIHDKE